MIGQNFRLKRIKGPWWVVRLRLHQPPFHDLEGMLPIHVALELKGHRTVERHDPGHGMRMIKDGGGIAVTA